MERCAREGWSGRAPILILAMLAASSCFPSVLSGVPVPEGVLPTALQPDPPEVAVEVESIGLGGYLASPERPTVARLALSNRGPARTVRVTFEEVVTEGSPGLYSTMRDRVAPLDVSLLPGEERRITWIVPVFNDGLMAIAPEKGGLFAVVRDRSGRILGAARAPRTQIYGMPIAVLAESDEVAIAIQDDILKAVPGTERPTVALITGEPPERFWEYEPASAVVLARPFSGLSPSQAVALRRFVAFGGTLVVPAELAAGAEELTRLDPGVGRIVVLPGVPGSGGTDRAAAWRSIVATSRTQGGIAEANLPLDMHIELPSTCTLLGMIGFVVLLVGPALHVVLARLRRRELAWIGVPGLSVLLAVAMYGLASGTKGVANGVEIQHLHISMGAAADAVVMSQVRVQSMRAASKTVRLVGAPGSDPRHDNLQRFLYGGGIFAAPAIRMSGAAVEIGPMAMHRWSSQDLAFASAGARIPLDVSATGEGGVRIVNTSGLALTEVDLRTYRGWTRVAASLAPGAQIALAEPPAPDPDPTSALSRTADAAWAAAYARSNLLATAAGVPRVAEAPDLRVLARCNPPGLPRVEVRPAAASVVEVSRCLWIVPGHAGEGGAP
jgi:hypothetical protein